MNVPRILIVDDDTALLQALPEALKLRMSPVDVDTCDSAAAALERLVRTDYDAVVTDIKMPGMDGLALLERIHALQPNTSTLLITGHGEHELTIRALRGGAYDFIQKPIDRDYFVSSLGRAIQMRRLRQQVTEQQAALERHADDLERLVQERTQELLEANLAKDELIKARDEALAKAKYALRRQRAARQQVEGLAEQLRQRAGELNTIIESMAEGIYVCNAEGQIIRVNARWAEMVGRPAANLLQSAAGHGELAGYRRLDGTALDADEYPLMQALQGITLTNMRLLIRQHSTGKDIPIQISSAPIYSAGGEEEIAGAVAVASDITGIYELERQKDEFLSIASHELKTPLASLKVLAQLTHRRLQRADIPVPTQLMNMERAIGRMETLVNDLVDISRIESGKLSLRLEHASLTALCKQAVEEQAAATDRVILFEPPSDPFVAEVDVNRIDQVLVNLLSNALKYSASERPVTLTLAREGDEAVIWVHDEGPGIPSEELPRIFDRFYRVPGIEVQVGSGVGLGLGLYISREIVERHSGRIWVETAEGSGSTFCVALRLTESSPNRGVAPGCEASRPR